MCKRFSVNNNHAPFQPQFIICLNLKKKYSCAGNSRLIKTKTEKKHWPGITFRVEKNEYGICHRCFVYFSLVRSIHCLGTVPTTTKPINRWQNANTTTLDFLFLISPSPFRVHSGCSHPAKLYNFQGKIYKLMYGPAAAAAA